MKYFELFPALILAIEEIKRTQPVGCEILQMIDVKLHSGLPHIQQAFLIIRSACHKVLYKQLASWIAYGEVYGDSGKEFFIQKSVTEAEAAKDPVADVFSWTGHVLLDQLLPPYISKALARKVFMTGETVVLLRPKSTSAFIPEHFQRSNAYAEKVFKELKPILSPTENDQDEEAGASVSSLQFNSRDLEWLLETYYEDLVKKLWELVTEDNKLMKELDIIEGWFLMGRGEFFQYFIDSAGGWLAMEPSESSLLQTKRVLSAAIHNLYPNEPDLDQKIDFKFSEKGKTGWDCLHMLHEPPWPLNLLLPQDLLNSFHDMFKFLLSVRRCTMNLNQNWLFSIKARHHLPFFTQRKDSSQRVHQLGALIQFVVNCLQNYIQLDVLDSLFTQLRADLNEIEGNFDEAKKRIGCFVRDVSNHLCVTKQLAPIHDSLQDLLLVCDKFCLVATKIEKWRPETAESKGGGGKTLEKEINSLYVEFQRKSVWFYHLISGVKYREESTHLKKLKLKLDFNSYFSSTTIMSK